MVNKTVFQSFRLFSLFVSVFIFVQSVASHDANRPILLLTEGWSTDTIAPGVVYYNFENYDEVSGAHQIVNVVDLDMLTDKYALRLYFSNQGIQLSSAAKACGAIAGCNAGYEKEAIYIKVNDSIVSHVSLPADHLRFWKHEGAVSWTDFSDLSVVMPLDGVETIMAYECDDRKNIIASAPMLVNDYDPCGLRFVNEAYTPDDLVKFHYESAPRHQGVRHPRTAIAVTENRHLLLVTVDGRWPQKGEGMSAKELTAFFVKYFNPRYALNMDGGGSTTMFVKDRGDSQTNVVNYPTDNREFDHKGERSVWTHFLIVPASIAD